jgi:hypothetical protein
VSESTFGGLRGVGYIREALRRKTTDGLYVVGLRANVGRLPPYDMVDAPVSRATIPIDAHLICPHNSGSSCYAGEPLGI